MQHTTNEGDAVAAFPGGSDKGPCGVVDGANEGDEMDGENEAWNTVAAYLEKKQA